MIRPTLSPDARWVFVGAWKGESARLYDASSELIIKEFPGNSVRGAFSPDGAWLVVCNGLEYVFFETGTWEQRHRLPRAHPYGTAGPMAFSANSSLFAMLPTLGAPCLIDVHSGRRLLTLPNPGGSHIAALAFVSTPESLVGLTTGNEILVWDISLIRAELKDLGLDWERTAD